MKQNDAVYEAMKAEGGYATLGHLYHVAMKVSDCNWRTKTPFASIRRIVQQDARFFKIKPGLWALSEQRDQILSNFSLSANTAANVAGIFDHTYFQGLIVEIGNLKKFQTFVPHQDKNRKYLRKSLVEVATLRHFNEFTYASLLRRGCTIDVTWFNERGFPDTFFEIEHSTDIQNSLLKFLEFRDFRIKFRIVADEARRREFSDKLGRNAYEPIRSNVSFVSYETVSDLHTKLSVAAIAEQQVSL